MSDIPGVPWFLWGVAVFKWWLSWHERSNIENDDDFLFSFSELIKSKMSNNLKKWWSCFDRHASFGGYNVDIKRKFRLEWWSRRQQIIGNKSGQLSIGYKEEEEEEEDGSFLVGWGPSCCLSSYVTLFVVLSWVEVNEFKVQKGISAQISWKLWLLASKEFRVTSLCLRSISNGNKKI